MIKTLVTFLLVFSIGLVSHGSQCRQVHVERNQSWTYQSAENLISIIRNNLVIGMGHEKLPPEIEVILQRTKQKHLVNLTHPERISISKTLEQTTEELFQLIYKKTLLQKISIYPRSEQRRVEWLQQQIIRKSLLEFTEENSSLYNLKRSQKLRANIRKYLVVAERLNGFPFGLPTVYNKVIPKSLIEKIMIDGYQAHRAEIEAIRPAQQRKEVYQAISYVYKLVSLAIIFNIASDMWQDSDAKAEQMIQENKAETLRELDHLSSSLAELDATLDEINRLN